MVYLNGTVALNRSVYYLVFFLSVSLLVVTVNSHAHHPVQSQYELDSKYIFEGVLKRVELGSPHSFLHILVVDEFGDEGFVKVEWGSASSLGRLYSIGRDSIQIEQRIRVRGYLSKNREDFMVWPMAIHTEFDVEYDRRYCNEIEKSGSRCRVLTERPPLWPVLLEN